MKTFELTLKKFLFPKELSDKSANFRFVVDLRFVNEDNQLDEKSRVMPSLHAFWECANDKYGEPNYVRGDDTERYVQFDMVRVGEWDQHIQRVNGKSLHSIQFTVFDVDRKGTWERFEKLTKGFVGAVIGKIKGHIPGDSGLSLPLGGAADDVHALLLRKIAGSDKVLFRGSHKFKHTDQEELCISGEEKEGRYKIKFSVTETDNEA